MTPKKIKKSTLTVKAELRDHQKKDGTHQVVLRITKDRKHIREKLNIYVKKSEWKGITDKWVSAKHPNYKKLNNTIQKKKIEYENKYLNLEEEQGDVELLDIYNTINKDHLKADFLKYWDLVRKGMTKYNNYKGYDTMRAKIVAFKENQEISFKSINSDWLGKFETHLRKTTKNNQTLYGYMKRIRRIWNIAIEDNIVDKALYPFGNKVGKYKMPDPDENLKPIERLETKEIISLFSLEFENGSRSQTVQKAFELSFNCAGIRIEDLLTLKWSNIRNGRLIYNMKKGVTNGKLRDIEVTKEIKGVLDLLGNGKHLQDDYILPFMEKGIENKDEETYKKEIGNKTSNFNNILKRVAKKAGITKSLTSHIAKHSWAKYTYDKTGDLRLIQKNLGHKDITTTMKYIGRLTDKENDTKLRTLYNDIYLKAS